MNIQKKLKIKRQRRKNRSRAEGTSERPRLSVYRSLKNIHAQLIDDENGKTLVYASAKDIGGKKLNKTEAAKEIGKILAEKAVAKKIIKVVFDKGAYKYHGRVKALADGAREGGLKF